MNDINKIKILIACEESQTVCLAFRKRGFHAFSCDIQPCSGGHAEWHFLGDCFDIIKNGGGTLENGKEFFIKKNWDVIIAHPPCTYLSNAGIMHLIRNNICYIDRYKKGIEAKAFFMKFFTVDCKHLAVENPVSITIFNLPKHSQTIQPYLFGHNLSKTTRLWLKNLPPSFLQQ